VRGLEFVAGVDAFALGAVSGSMLVVLRPGVTDRKLAAEIAGKAGGTKLLEIRRLAEQGHNVTVIGERQFWRLAEAKSVSKKPKKRRISRVR